jgi:septum formation protein
MKLILASSSPRRQELLSALGYDFTAEAADIDETLEKRLSPPEAVMKLAERKAEEVYKNHPGDCVVGADTLVFLDGDALGKPEGPVQAREMLRRLSGRRHEVLSGAAIISPQGTEAFYVRTAVSFYELSEEFIERYLATGEPFDKAGAYGIQRFGALLVRGIEGDYFNVVGLPVAELARRLEGFGIRPRGF